MTGNKRPKEEQRIIVSRPEKRPYGAAVTMHTRSPGAFGQGDGFGIEFGTGVFVNIAPARKAPWEGGSKYTLKLEGFPTAGAAEAGARRLVQALLWMSISSDAPLRLDYNSYDPFAIFERNQTKGFSFEAYGEVYYSEQVIFREIKEAYEALAEPNQKLLLSMEIFAGAQLEASDRARFLAAVSALEPLADEQDLGESIKQFVDTCLHKLRAIPDLRAEVRASLEGRVRQLRNESVRQAVQRVVREALPGRPEAVKAVDLAYGLRSQIIHSGRPEDLDIDLEYEMRAVSNLMRQLYAGLLRRPLLKQSAV